MNMKKLLTAFGLVATFGLVACGSDSSSNSSSDEPSSSSSAAPVVLPEASADSLLDIINFKAELKVSTVEFMGNIVANQQYDTSVVIDSVSMYLATENGISVPANFALNPMDETMRQSLSIKRELNPVLDLNSFEECGPAMQVYLVAYGHSDSQQIVAKDTTAFEKKCPVEESSSSSEAVVPVLTPKTVTLYTSVTEENAIDLDTWTTYITSEREANAEAIDLYLGKSGGVALFTNASLGATSPSKIGEEEKSQLSAADDPDSLRLDEIRFNESKLADVATDFEMISSYVVVTSSYDATTGKGLFVVLPGKTMNVGSGYSMELIVLGIWD